VFSSREGSFDCDGEAPPPLRMTRKEMRTKKGRIVQV
jgi:hypothetical protein